LVSFQGDRTVLAHRGANATIKKDDVNFEAIKSAKMLYIAPLNGESTKVLDDIVNFAKENDVKICFNAGSSSIKKGFSYIKKILENAHIVVMNKEEATMATGIQVRPDTRDEKFSNELIHPDIKKMFKTLKVSAYQVIVITDGGKGAYAYDGNKFYYCPIFEGPTVSTLGAGDAFASTFGAALWKKGIDVGKALMYASVNSAGVVSAFGATQGLMTFDEIEDKLKATPNYTYQIAED
jgi:ribokinase